MKVFLSHQRADSLLAGRVAARLKVPHGIDSYLDVIDPDASNAGDELGDYVRAQLALCTQLMAVVSTRTRGSWWVPWEIGIATEKDFPIATFAGEQCDLPVYLKKWPYLRTEQDLDIYAREAKKVEQEVRRRTLVFNESVSKAQGTRSFHRALRAALGQV